MTCLSWPWPIVLYQSSCSITKHKSVPLLGDLNLPANEKDLIVQVFVNVMTRTSYWVGPLWASLSHDTSVTSHTVFRSPSPVTSQLLVCCDHFRSRRVLRLCQYDITTSFSFYQTVNVHTGIIPKAYNYEKTFLNIKHHLCKATSTRDSRATGYPRQSAVLPEETFEMRQRRNNVENLRDVFYIFYIDMQYITNSFGKTVIKTATSSQGCELYFFRKSSYHQYSFIAPKVQKNEQVKLHEPDAFVRIIRK